MNLEKNIRTSTTRYNINYGLDVKHHKSKESPPVGPIWEAKKPKSHPKNTVDTAMATAFTKMADSVASAFKVSQESKTPKPVSPMLTQTPVKESSFVGISPGRKIDLQEKLLKQIDLLHKMLEKGCRYS